VNLNFFIFNGQKHDLVLDQETKIDYAAAFNALAREGLSFMEYSIYFCHLVQ